MRTENIERARRETFARVIERLARVGAAILGEDFGNYEFMNVGFAAVLEVLARCDLFVVVQPDDIELSGADDAAAECHCLAVVHHHALDVVDYLRRVLLVLRGRRCRCLLHSYNKRTVCKEVYFTHKTLIDSMSDGGRSTYG